ncbi:hypothetical protein J2799_003007 [Chryseobacterium vietnamense]|uniref:hypothetical protein n=1 Tax=Chryseobacterium vietnamense TaxID=866785 RepID=UPI00285BE4F6|nr:hypothetical protein [Chryseobacterium vietnamense]MDR6488489.1 hypothetical protein [Chryseobacterium vietnamense]
MNKFILLFILLFIVSCKKSEEAKNYKDLNSTKYFSISTDLKNLKNIEKNKVNDSLYKVKGIFKNYAINGYITNNNIRINWWSAFDNKTKELLAKLEYKLIDNKEFVNQYILFENKSIDTLGSKFYSVKKNANSVSYKFYMPSQLKKLNCEGKLNYHIYSKGTEQAHLQCKCIKNANIFNCEFPIPKDLNFNDITIRGNFWEMFQLENGDIGGNDIYVLDTLK